MVINIMRIIFDFSNIVLEIKVILYIIYFVIKGMYSMLLMYIEGIRCYLFN